MKPYLSVIIPAFNEIDRISNTIFSVNSFLKNKKYTYEIIVVDDGSDDGTYDLLERIKKGIPVLRVTRLSKNNGKGTAVKEGMLSAKGEVRLFMDADGSTSITEIDKLILFIENGYDVVVGSRIIAGSLKKIKQSFIREFLGWIYRILVHTLINIDVKDTQNGFKLFSQNSAEMIFNSIEVKGWGFDIEIFLIAKKMNYLVKEIPITWVNDRRSKMNFTQMIRMLSDLFLLRKKYYEYI